MDKNCYRCQTIKSLEDFHKQTNICKVCKSTYDKHRRDITLGSAEWREKNRQYYESHKEKVNLAVRRHRKNNPDKVKATLAKYRKKHVKEIRTWYYELKSKLKCSNCSENNPYCLDFHHVNPELKEFTISQKITRKNKQQILEEIRKCIVLCANCHRKITYC